MPARLPSQAIFFLRESDVLRSLFTRFAAKPTI